MTDPIEIPMRARRRGRAGALALAACVPAACGESPPPPEPPPPGGPRTVVLVSIDTLRQDHLGLYGYGRDTSPAIDALARDAAVFEQAYAQSTYTLPSHMSLMTSLYPQTHGVLLGKSAAGPTRLADEVVTVAEVLAADGFETRAITDGGYVSGRYGFDQGFDEYADEWKSFRGHHEVVREWFGERPDGDLFLFLHTFDVHGPYDVPEPFVSRFAAAPPGREVPHVSLLAPSLAGCHEHLRLERFAGVEDVVDRYDGCIAYVDHELGRLFELLRETGRYDDALIVVTSDHGEAFLENGAMIGHGIYSTAEEQRVPLVVKFPRGRFAGRRSDHTVELVDVMPTVLAAFGIQAPPDVVGQDLAAGLRAGAWRKDHAFGCTPNTGGNVYLVRDGLSYMEPVRQPPGTVVRRHLDPLPIVARLVEPPPRATYRLSADPLGLVRALSYDPRVHDLSERPFQWQAPAVTDAATIERLRSEAAALEARALAGAFATTTSGADDAAASSAQLRALGYVGADAPVDPAPAAGRPDGRPTFRPEDAVRPPRFDFLDPRVNEADDLLWELLRALPADADAAAVAEGFTAHPDRERAAAIYAERIRARPDLARLLEWRPRIGEALGATDG